jgi:hypothetical protein
MNNIGKPENWRFDIGDRVNKIRGSKWRGYVCGFYSTDITPSTQAERFI